MAARKGSLEIIALFAELVKEPTSSIKIKLLKLIIECEEERDATVEAFKQQLESISEARSLKQSGELISYMPDLTCIIASKKSSKLHYVASSAGRPERHCCRWESAPFCRRQQSEGARPDSS